MMPSARWRSAPTSGCSRRTKPTGCGRRAPRLVGESAPDETLPAAAVRRLDDAGEPGAEPGRGAEQVVRRSGGRATAASSEWRRGVAGDRFRCASTAGAGPGTAGQRRQNGAGGRAGSGRAEEEVGDGSNPRGGAGRDAAAVLRQGGEGHRGPRALQPPGRGRVRGSRAAPGGRERAAGVDRPRAACRRSRTSRRRRSAASTCT